MGYPLPSDLPAERSTEPPPRPLAWPREPEPLVAPLDPPAALPSTPAATEGETFVDRIRALTELYRDGMLDDDEFAAAKAVVLRDRAP